MEESLSELMGQFKWHWSLEKVSEGVPHKYWDRWIVYDTDTGDALGDATTPEQAIYMALHKPLNAIIDAES